MREKKKKQKKKNLLSSAGAENCFYLSLEWYHLPFVLKVKPTIKKSIIRIQTLQTPGSPHYFQDFAKTPSLYARLVTPACFRTSCEIFQASGLERERSRLVDFSAWRGARSAWMIRTVGGWTHSRGKRQVLAKGVVQKESRRRGRLLPPLWMGERQTGKYSKHQADRRSRWLLLTVVESRLPVRPHLVWHVYPQAAFWQCLRRRVSTLPFQSCLSLFRSLSVNSGTAVNSAAFSCGGKESQISYLDWWLKNPKFCNSQWIQWIQIKAEIDVCLLKTCCLCRGRSCAVDGCRGMPNST